MLAEWVAAKRWDKWRNKEGERRSLGARSHIGTYCVGDAGTISGNTGGWICSRQWLAIQWVFVMVTTWRLRKGNVGEIEREL